MAIPMARRTFSSVNADLGTWCLVSVYSLSGCLDRVFVILFFFCIVLRGMIVLSPSHLRTQDNKPPVRSEVKLSAQVVTLAFQMFVWALSWPNTDRRQHANTMRPPAVMVSAS
jgi:hypothetical protein